jgi:hypothetical protein
MYIYIYLFINYKIIDIKGIWSIAKYINLYSVLLDLLIFYVIINILLICYLLIFYKFTYRKW